MHPTRSLLTALALAATVATPAAALAASGDDDGISPGASLEGQENVLTYRIAEGELTGFDVSYWCHATTVDRTDSDRHRSRSRTSERTLLRKDANGRLRGTVKARNTRFSEDNENRPIRAGQVRFDLRVTKTPAGRTRIKGTFTPIAHGCDQRPIALKVLGR